MPKSGNRLKTAGELEKRKLKWLVMAKAGQYQLENIIKLANGEN